MDKINVYVPENIGNILENDAVMFEIYKKDGKTINKNRFLSMIITGYCTDYMANAKDSYNKIISAIDLDGVSASDKERIADKILKEAVLPVMPSRKGKNPVRLSLKPTKDTEMLIEQIMQEIGSRDYISQYFCRMFMSYCEKPINERERIVFKDTYEKLQDASAAKRTISFKTIWNPETIHNVIPYKTAVGVEEMFNYLLCAEVNSNTGKQEAKSYRLNRIGKISYGRNISSIEDKTRRFLDRMIKYGSQYAINDDEESCVTLTDAGVRNFSRIYYGRPKVDRIEEKEGRHFYYFKCSKDQIFLYFRRFGYDNAEIIAPESLRERMIEFHSKAYSMYQKGKNHD